MLNSTPGDMKVSLTMPGTCGRVQSDAIFHPQGVQHHSRRKFRCSALYNSQCRIIGYPSGCIKGSVALDINVP